MSELAQFTAYGNPFIDSESGELLEGMVYPDYLDTDTETAEDIFGKDSDFAILRPELANLSDDELKNLIGYQLEPQVDEGHEEEWKKGKELSEKLGLDPCHSDISDWDDKTYGWLVTNMKEAIKMNIIFSIGDGGDGDVNVDMRVEHDEDNPSYGRTPFGEDVAKIPHANSERETYLPVSLFTQLSPFPTEFVFDLRMPYPIINWLQEQAEGKELVIKYGKEQVGESSSPPLSEAELRALTEQQVEAWKNDRAASQAAEEEVPIGAKIMNRVVDSARWQRYLEQDYKLSILKRKIKEVDQLQKELILATLNYPNILIL